MTRDGRKSKPQGKPDSQRGSLVIEHIEQSIVVIRGHKVLLDQQLAAFYGVQTKDLVRAMKRNTQRFPDDFMFQLSRQEWDALRFQIGALNAEGSEDVSGPKATSVTKSGRGQHRKYLPYAFTEQGVAMLSGVLHSVRAVEVNIQIMRAFVRLRQLLAVHRELAERLEKIERQMMARDQDVEAQFRKIFALLDRLFNPPAPPRKPIGFQAAPATRTARQSARTTSKTQNSKGKTSRAKK